MKLHSKVTPRPLHKCQSFHGIVPESNRKYIYQNTKTNCPCSLKLRIKVSKLADKEDKIVKSKYFTNPKNIRMPHWILQKRCMKIHFFYNLKTFLWYKIKTKNANCVWLKVTLCRRINQHYNF